MAFSIQTRNRKKHRAMSEINVTPFVDVLLVLLIIFMVAAPMMTGSVDVSLPEGGGEQIKEDLQPIAVSIKSNGTVFIGDENVAIHLLQSKLLLSTNKDFNRKIHIRADKKIDYGKVMEVVKTIGGAGFSQVILVTDLSK